MGLITLSGDTDVPFPRRLFAALVHRKTDMNRAHQLWEELHLKYLGGGCYLDIDDFSEEELVAFRTAIADLRQHVIGLEFYV